MDDYSTNTDDLPAVTAYDKVGQLVHEIQGLLAELTPSKAGQHPLYAYQFEKVRQELAICIEKLNELRGPTDPD